PYRGIRTPPRSAPVPSPHLVRFARRTQVVAGRLQCERLRGYPRGRVVRGGEGRQAEAANTARRGAEAANTARRGRRGGQETGQRQPGRHERGGACLWQSPPRGGTVRISR